MAAGKLNIEIEQGSTFKHRLQLKSGNLPLNLTGFIARMQIRKTVEDALALLSLSNVLVGGSGLIITPTTGEIDIQISATDTAKLRIVSGVYDLEIESSAGEVTRIIQGVVTNSREVTR